VRAKRRGATASIHSIDLFEPANTVRLHRLLQEVDTQAGGIDIAISCASVTGHRIDVLDKNVEHIPPLDTPGQADGSPRDELPDQGDVWGATTASRMLQVNVAANQEFILRCWELMKARRQRGNFRARPRPKIIVLSSSTAFFTPATFALYAASKAYLYSLAQSLQIASVPYGIGVITVTPGFMRTGMTATMSAAGATYPTAILGDPWKLASKIRRSEERDESVVFYPELQACSLFALRGLNPLLETFGMWAGAATGVATWFFS
jgi:NAD(P)-dependent dehydrogenase (short-subunit alcohol dehydrogenase family)